MVKFLMIFVVSIFSCGVFAQSKCSELFHVNRLKTILEINSTPADISFLEKSDNIEKEIRSRFELQKSLTPRNPYQFKIPELQKTVDFMRLVIDERISQYGSGTEIVWRDYDKFWLNVYNFFGLRSPRLKLYKKLKAEKLYLLKLREDLRQLDANGVPYDKLIESSYFVTRILSKTDPKKQLWMHMFLDLAQETKIHDISKEQIIYETPESAFNTSSNWLSRHFVYGNRGQLFDPNKMNLVVLPVVGALTIESFLKYRHQQVHIMSVIWGNLAADGWNMNAHQLGVHDYYFHGAQKFKRDQEFEKTYNLNPEQKERLFFLQKKWFEELWQAKNNENDPKLKAAITEMISYVLHDRPQPFFPDSFLKWNKIMFSAKVRHKIVGQLAQDGISDVLIENLIYNYKAVSWLNDFWRQDRYNNDPFVVQLRSQRDENKSL